MTKLWAIIRKDTLVRFASPVEWIFFLVLPLLFTLVLGFSQALTPKTACRSQ